MNVTLWALLGAFLASLGGRDQLVVAGLTARLGRHAGLLLLAVVTGLLASAAAAWASGALGGMVSRRAAMVLAAMALGVAGLESLLLPARFSAKEPTRSFFAAGLVLSMHQMLDATRFLVLALALATQAPLQAAAGGAMGTALAMGLGWSAGAAMLDNQRALQRARRWAGLLLLAAALGLAGWIFGNPIT
jgi:putative Ca2+/H+ antiporter (TMEM165/GDT1 family)